MFVIDSRENIVSREQLTARRSLIVDTDDIHSTLSGQ